MSRRLIIIGCGGHGRVCAEIAETMYEEVYFLDDNPKDDSIGCVSDYGKYINFDFFVAIGDNKTRKKITESLKGANIVSLVHKDAYVSPTAIIGKGTVVMAGAVVNTNTVLGEGTIVNTLSSIDHDCTIGDYSHVAVGAHIAGGCAVEDLCLIGAGSVIINNINVCSGTVIGAGAAVVKNIIEPGTYVGVPACKYGKKYE